MKYGMVIAGALMLMVGATWFLQGMDVMGGSMMSGQTFWAIAGLVLGILGSVVIRRSLRKLK